MKAGTIARQATMAMMARKAKLDKLELLAVMAVMELTGKTVRTLLPLSSLSLQATRTMTLTTRGLPRPKPRSIPAACCQPATTPPVLTAVGGRSHHRGFSPTTKKARGPSKTQTEAEGPMTRARKIQDRDATSTNLARLFSQPCNLAA